MEAYYPAPLDAWYEVLCWPNPDGLSLYFADVTERTRAARRAEAASARLALLARASSDLVVAADVTAAIATLPRLLVPTLADGCIVTLLEEDGRPRDMGTWHAQPAIRPLLAEYSAARLAAMPVTSPIARSLATGEPVRSSADEVSGLLVEGRARTLLQLLDAADVLVLPISVRDRVLGAVSLFSGAGRARDAEDEATAGDIADRAGLALDNARLLQTQSQ